MMGRDDIPVGLGNVTALGTPSLGCKYVKAIPHGSGGFLDSDTVYGLARTLPRSPRRYFTLAPMLIWINIKINFIQYFSWSYMHLFACYLFAFLLFPIVVHGTSVI